MAKTFDPYRALGVRRDATEADVKAAHRKLAKRFHPDAANGDTGRFLDVQEAYRVLSDPLLRREWDATHAPGPLRAERPAPAPRWAPGARRESPAREPAAQSEPRSESAGPDAAAGAEPSNGRPRSSRAYTWSAAEVPWWEEGSSENRRRPRGRPRPASTQQQASDAAPESPPAEAPNPFDVYNRSSGAAWSMAARAYFRRGDQDLPRRGTFHYEGTQALTGARARAAAETEARRRKAQQTREHAKASSHTGRDRAAGAGAGAARDDASATATGPAGAAGAASMGRAHAGVASAEAGIARDARHTHQLRQAMRRRSSAASWPSLRERLLYALLAWVPAAIVIGYGGAAVTGCDRGSLGCPPNLETAQALAIALVLGAFVALPKLAYIAAMAAAGALLVGLLVVGFVAFVGVELPLPTALTTMLGATMLIAYLVSGAAALLRNSSARPRSGGARP